jgi:hypothetical protein
MTDTNPTPPTKRTPQRIALEILAYPINVPPDKVDMNEAIRKIADPMQDNFKNCLAGYIDVADVELDTEVMEGTEVTGSKDTFREIAHNKMHLELLLRGLTNIAVGMECDHSQTERIRSALAILDLLREDTLTNASESIEPSKTVMLVTEIFGKEWSEDPSQHDKEMISAENLRIVLPNLFKELCRELGREIIPLREK